MHADPDPDEKDSRLTLVLVLSVLTAGALVALHWFLPRWLAAQAVQEILVR